MKWNWPRISFGMTVGFPGSASVLKGYGAHWVPFAWPFVFDLNVPMPLSFLSSDGAIDDGAPFGGTR